MNSYPRKGNCHDVSGTRCKRNSKRRVKDVTVREKVDNKVHIIRSSSSAGLPMIKILLHLQEFKI